VEASSTIITNYTTQGCAIHLLQYITESDMSYYISITIVKSYTRKYYVFVAVVLLQVKARVTMPKATNK